MTTLDDTALQCVVQCLILPLQLRSKTRCVLYIMNVTTARDYQYEFDVTSASGSRRLKLCENDLWRKTR